MKELKRDSSIDITIHQSILGVIKDNWDSSYKQGASRPMFDFQSCLDTCDSPPVCYRQPVYGIHERKITNTHINVLEDNDWICDYVDP